MVWTTTLTPSLGILWSFTWPWRLNLSIGHLTIRFACRWCFNTSSHLTGSLSSQDKDWQRSMIRNLWTGCFHSNRKTIFGMILISSRMMNFRTPTRMKKGTTFTKSMRIFSISGTIHNLAKRRWIISTINHGIKRSSLHTPEVWEAIAGQSLESTLLAESPTSHAILIWTSKCSQCFSFLRCPGRTIQITL